MPMTSRHPDAACHCRTDLQPSPVIFIDIDYTPPACARRCQLPRSLSTLILRYARAARVYYAAEEAAGEAAASEGAYVARQYTRQA